MYKIGGELFIIDNSESGWTALEYLRQWTELARSFDIATGFFEINAFLDLDSKWQQLEKIRLLIGNEISLRTHHVFVRAIQDRITCLENSLEDEKTIDPFLNGVNAIVEGLQEGKIECRIYRHKKFHAKAYITHAKFDVVGAQALVGSSNFTRAGLTKNVELNIQVQSGREVSHLQEWFNVHWKEAIDITEEVLRSIVRHIEEYTPFDIYAKALHEFFRGRELTAGEWEESHSKVFKALDRYQKEAYASLIKISRRYGGAFLCDGVGLGKTFVGLMLIERLVLHENRRVVLFAPKGAKEAVWTPHLQKWLPHIGGVGGGEDFSNLTVFSHTDLSRRGKFPERFHRIAGLADAVVIDEAHHFRNRGHRGDTDAEMDQRSRYYRLYDLLDRTYRPKLVFLLTATPVNNRLADFRHMAELFTRGNDAFFSRSLGVNHLSNHFNKMEYKLKESFFRNSVEEGTSDLLVTDEVFNALVVQRSRSYAKASQIQEGRKSSDFPVREAPKVAEYVIKGPYRKLLNMLEEAFRREHPLFSLAIYYPLAYYKGPDESIDVFEKNRQQQVVGLIRTLFLKRFESSVYAFHKSLDILMRKLLAFVEINSVTIDELDRYVEWKLRNATAIGYRPEVQLGLDLGHLEPLDDIMAEEDVIPPELLKVAEELSRNDYDVPRILDNTFADLDQIVKFLEFTVELTVQQDDKSKTLIQQLQTYDLSTQKVLIFTEFADTARYLESQLRSAGIDHLARIDGGSKVDRAEIIRRFSPYYNGSSSTQLARLGQEEIRVLVSTDVLSEGLNLQDATRLINYDIHWNPVRLMQRIGRVDRRMNSEIEEQLITEHPEAASDRGTVRFWNFLPPDDLERILALYKRVAGKTLLISKTLGIEGSKLLRPEDDFESLREFNAKYEGKKTIIEEMRLEYRALLEQYPGLENRLDNLPGSVFSGRKNLTKGTRGVFFCFSLPAFDSDRGDFTLEAGTTRWYLYTVEDGAIVESPGAIITSIRSKPNTPRYCEMDQNMLKDVRAMVEKHVRNSYLKLVNAPLGAPKPKLRCWMEIT